ncbi:MAG: 5-deoxy-glucuronate isomerase [Caldilineaceae bacterium]
MQKQMQYTAENILVRPTQDPNDPDLILSVTPEEAGWDYISFQARRLATGQRWSFSSGENELAIVNLTGVYAVTSNRGEWRGIGGRDSVFTGAAHALYLPRHTDFTITAEQGGDFAVTWVPTDEDHAPWLIKPADVPISIRGGDNVSRQINDLLPPGGGPPGAVHRLVLVEVYTPSGNWSSYPGHKHDVHLEENGQLIEADLEEVYFYKIDKPNGYAYQRVYTDEHSPLHKAGYPIDALVRATDNTAVLVPEGYHPVTSAPGYTTYYLNVLAGSAQSLANQDDPNATWVKTTYKGVDPRLPLY